MRTFAWALIVGAALVGACSDGNITTGNSPPSATILTPSDGVAVSQSQPLQLSGVVGDRGTAVLDLRVTWTSSVGGLLFDGGPDDTAGNTRFLWNTPAAGTQDITLAVIDPGGVSATATVRVTIIGNVAPTCAITAPSDGVAVSSASPLLFQGQVGDAEETPETLLIEWVSNIDGAFGATAPTSAGVVSTTRTLSPGLHSITLTVRDDGDQTCMDTILVPVNAPPSVPEIAFDPPAPRSVDDLRVVITTPSEDPEGTEVTYVYAWFEDGADAGIPGDSVLSADLDKGAVWTVNVQAVDEDGFASALAQASVTVQNSLPSAPGVALTPAAPTQADDLLCAVSSPSADPDGDGVSYVYGWQRDGLATGLSGGTLPWDETDVGELWTCTVTPNDGTASGAPASATVTVSAGCASLAMDSANPGAATVPDDPALRLSAGDFTVEAWIRLDALGPTESSAIVSKRGVTPGDGWHFGVGGTGTIPLPQRLLFLRSDVDGDAVVSASVVPMGGWHHVAASFDSGSGLLTLWVDGANVGSGTIPAPGAATTADLVLGASSAAGSDTWDGGIDDVRISDVRRYTTAFVPASLLGADADTVAWWGFEEAGGLDAKDLSGAGHDAVLSGGAAFDASVSTCLLDQAPTAPVVTVSPDYPLLSQNLSCALVTPSVDAEGAPVTYAGLWLRDGVPSGQSFTTFPATLSSAYTGLGEQWTCSVTASDGGQSGPAGTDSVWTGAMPVGGLAVTNPAAPASTSVTFAPPVAGMLRATMLNPDASRDGAFSIDVLGYGTFWLFTGYRGWAYGGPVVAGFPTTDVEFNLSPSLGTLTLDLDYLVAAAPDGTGVDTLNLLFVYGTQLSLTGATFLVGSDVPAMSTNAAQVVATFTANQRLLLQTANCGAGGGGHGLYKDGDGVAGNDGLARIDTGFAGNCSIPLQSRPVGAGTYTLTLVNEDDFFQDNTDQREVNLYRYTP